MSVPIIILMNTENHQACETFTSVNGCQTLDGFQTCVSPSYFYYGTAPYPFSPVLCPFSQRHALFLNLHIMPYILVKNHKNLAKTKEVLNPVVTNKAAEVTILSRIGCLL